MLWCFLKLFSVMGNRSKMEVDTKNLFAIGLVLWKTCFTTDSAVWI